MHYVDFQLASLCLPRFYSSSAILLIVNNLKGSKCVIVKPLQEISSCCVCTLNVLVKTEVPEKPVCYIQVLYVIKKQEMQRMSIKTCFTNNSRQKKPGVNKKMRVTFIFSILKSYKLIEKKTHSLCVT